MPTYTYKCTEGHLTEVVHPMDHPGPAFCMELVGWESETNSYEPCHEPIRRVVTAVGIIFKGSGWAGKEK